MKILWKTPFFNKRNEVEKIKLKLSKKVDSIKELNLIASKITSFDKDLKVIIPVEDSFLKIIDKNDFVKIKDKFILEASNNNDTKLEFVKTISEVTEENKSSTDIVIIDYKNKNKDSLINYYQGKADIVLINVESEDQIKAYSDKVSCFETRFYLDPVLDPDKRIKSNSINVIKTLDLIRSNPFIEAEEIERELKKSPDTMFSLFRHLSSAAYSFKNEITSIKQVMVFLGRKGLEKILKTFLLTDKESSPYGQMIMDRAIIRANIMLKIMEITKNEEFYGQIYIAGTFSLLEALFQVPNEKTIPSLHLDSNIEDLLVRKEGQFLKIFHIAKEIEKIEFDSNKLNEVFEKYKIPVESLESILEDSILAS